MPSNEEEEQPLVKGNHNQTEDIPQGEVSATSRTCNTLSFLYQNRSNGQNTEDKMFSSSVQIRLGPATTFERIICFTNQMISKIGPKCCLVIFLIAVTVVIASMVIHRLNVFNKYCWTDIVVILVYSIPNIVGVIGFAVLIYKNYNSSCVKNRANDFTFLKFKLILLLIFGLGYLLHSGLYVWKHTFPEDCPDNRWLDIIYNLSSMIYIVVVFFYFALFYDRKLEHTVTKHCCALTSIIVASVCIWLNAILFESDFLYQKNVDNVHSTTKKNSSNISNIAVEAIEKIDTFCAPAMVEFSLMVIDMLFTNNDNTTEGSPKKKMTENGNKSWKIKIIVEICVPIFVLLLVFAFFSFVLVVVLTTNASDNLYNHPAYFITYVCFELFLKVIMLFFLIICIYNEHKYVFTCGCKLSSVVLFATATANCIYHILYCVALRWEGNYNMSTIISLINNIASIFVAISQTWFIKAIHSEKYREQSRETKRIVYYACFILGVFNLGLWISDSIAEDRISVFSFLYYWVKNNLGLSIFYTASFPITIFFRFQAGLDFLEFFWEHETVANESIPPGVVVHNLNNTEDV